MLGSNSGSRLGKSNVFMDKPIFVELYQLLLLICEEGFKRLRRPCDYIDIDKIRSDVWLVCRLDLAGRLRPHVYTASLFVQGGARFHNFIGLNYSPWTPSPCWTLISHRRAARGTPWSPRKREEPGPHCQHPSVASLWETSAGTTTGTTQLYSYVFY